MRIGIDVDGVLADWSNAFLRLLVTSTGRPCPVPTPVVFPCWEWITEFGYTAQEAAAAYATMRSWDRFWVTLEPYPTAVDDIYRLTTREAKGDDIYFITCRSGVKVKAQTEMWLKHCGFQVRPTVLITPEKGLAAKVLGLDCYIDDNDENADDVMQQSPETRMFMMNRSWNADCNTQATRVDSVHEMLLTMKIHDRECAEP